MCSSSNKKSRLLENSIRTDLLKSEIINCVKSAWAVSCNSPDLKNSGIEIIPYPFRVCLINNFIQSTDLLKLVAEELKGVTFHQKSNDLYQFTQSDDVKNLTNYTFIPQLYNLINVEGLDWIKKIFDVRLKGDISATFSSYKCHDRLLCHDDKCEDRHIAFILYLVEDWTEEDGGALQLFNTDSNLYPLKVVKSIKPEFNTMVLFEVTHQSFHQVAEVLSNTKERLSLNGWFHSSEKKLEKPNCRILEIEKNYGNDKDFNLEEYFLFSYLDKMNKLDIKNMFLAESEIQLQEFLVEKFWTEIKNDLKSNNLKWIFKGPANIRKYEVAELSSFLPSIQTLKEIFESKCWFRYLKSITGLDLAPSESSDLAIWARGNQPYCNFEVQKWTPSCYTLIHDQDPEFHSKALDIILRIPFEVKEGNNFNENRDEPESGHIIYIDAESKDEDCLLHIGYKMNSLALIFRDTETLRFTKYLDSTTEPFYQIFCTYRPWEPPEDQPDLRHCEDDSESENSNSECASLSSDECIELED